MRRLFSTITFLGLFAISSGFSAPKSTNIIASTTTTRRQQFPPRPTCFPIARSTTSCPNIKFQSIITTQMTNNESEDEKILEVADNTSEAAAMSGTINGDTTAISSKDTDTTTTTTSASDESKSNGFSLILLPTLLFKFTIVMCVKFATDIVVFPLLWLYRLARLGKRKFMGGIKKLFGKKVDLDVKVNGVNGDSSSSP